MKVTIYGNDYCAWCLRAKKLCEKHDIAYEFKDTDDQSIHNELKMKLQNFKTIPQIWVNDKHIGGYEFFSDVVDTYVAGATGE